MKLIHRRANPEADKPYILERHCRNNYECDTPWHRVMPYDQYRAEWYGLSGQVNGFWDYFVQTLGDPRCVADIVESETGEIVAFIWAPFNADEESGFCFAEVQDLYVEEPFRRAGVAAALMAYVEDNARAHGAKVVRSGTGCENDKSVGLHKKLGYYQYRYEFEKLL